MFTSCRGLTIASAITFPTSNYVAHIVIIFEPEKQALARLHGYHPPSPSIYSSLPLSCRAAVLILLFADRRGDLRVVLTLRSPLLRTFAGHVALPGGKADFLSETAVETARREAYEEIGLPLDSQPFPPPFAVEHITELPCSLARTGLAVRPCVAFLKDGSREGCADVEDALVPRVAQQEVSSVFTVPLERFLHLKYPARGKGVEDDAWYQGGELTWNGVPWRMHEFQAPVWEKNTLRKYRVWGMTSKILVDIARIAYGRDPEFEFTDTIGDEAIIKKFYEAGEMNEGPRNPNPGPAKGGNL